ncbi:hypothetical protein P879_06912 [Paragonimus westermani]|uniref:Geranylgeranyl transferase type-2 subunit alpha n=1 Tax=Paragonimus westermani TaxID=34504 RepID=A0A8T0DS40_9TREM|nr:hypothetical protein P879_06912 [Paragonimus westermani]
MHGRVKVRRSEEQEKIQKEKKEKGEKELRCALNDIFRFRREHTYEDKQLKLIEAVIEKCAEMTTLWNYRREILKHMFVSLGYPNDKVGSLLDHELSLTANCLTNFPKSYAIWHHRVWVMRNHVSPSWASEIEFCNSALKLDERNFHCWDYRRFVVSQGKIPTTSELLYTEESIGMNMSNYSAWHYRSELLSSSHPSSDTSLPVSPPPSQIVDYSTDSFGDASIPAAELELVHNAIYTDPNDQSPWFYYWWLLGRGIRKAYLRELYISRPLSRIVIVFTSAKARSALEQLDVSIKVTAPSTAHLFVTVDALGGWQSALNENVSAVWWLPISPDLISSFAPVNNQEEFESDSLHFDVSVCIRNIGNSHESKVCTNPFCPPDHLFCLHCTLVSTQNESLTRVDLDPLRLLNPVISPTNEPSTLSALLDNIRDLVEMEPKNKWALLTYIDLLRFVHPSGSIEDINRALDTLMSVDSERTTYYLEMKVSHSVQDALALAYSERSREVVMSGLRMLNMRYLDWCTLLTKIDLSVNNIMRLPDTIAYLICLCELNLDDNCLVTLNGISRLPSLQILSARRNCLSEFSSIEELLLCPKLQNASIHGNKVTELPYLTRLLAEHPGSKAKSHSIVVIYDKSLQL